MVKSYQDIPRPLTMQNSVVVVILISAVQQFYMPSVTRIVVILSGRLVKPFSREPQGRQNAKIFAEEPSNDFVPLNFEF